MPFVRIGHHEFYQGANRKSSPLGVNFFQWGPNFAPPPFGRDMKVSKEILGGTLEEACLKKGDIFSADLHPIL
jgi:hypothetical protein